jgi:small subunit ribosomal protein S35
MASAISANGLRKECQFYCPAHQKTAKNNPAMATALQSFRFTARSCTCRPSAHQHATTSIGRRRPFSATALRCEKQDDTDPALRAALDKAHKGPNSQRGKFLESEVSSFDKKIQRLDESAKNIFQNRITRPVFHYQRRKEKVPKTFLNEGEDEAIDGFPEYDDEEDDDISTLAHGELEHHREMRHYARLAAWEMPMLASKYPDIVNIAVPTLVVAGFENNLLTIE